MRVRSSVMVRLVSPRSTPIVPEFFFFLQRKKAPYRRSRGINPSEICPVVGLTLRRNRHTWRCGSGQDPLDVRALVELPIVRSVEKRPCKSRRNFQIRTRGSVAVSRSSGQVNVVQWLAVLLMRIDAESQSGISLSYCLSCSLSSCFPSSLFLAGVSVICCPFPLT
jgi:hypothetical protein